jgi:hypothetical protein
MAEHDEGSPPGSYPGPPPTEQFAQPQYPTARYSQYPAGQYPQYPAYGQQPYGQPYAPAPYGAPPGYGYPPPGYGYPPYPAAPTGPRRPGLVMAASVLGYVNAGLLLLAGVLLFFGAAVVSDLEDVAGSNTSYDTEFALDGIVNFVAAGLVIAGAVMLTGRKPVGRILLAVGNGIVVASCVYWLVRMNSDRFDGAGDGWAVWTAVFGALAILTLAFSFVSDVTRWLNRTEQSQQ